MPSHRTMPICPERSSSSCSTPTASSTRSASMASSGPLLSLPPELLLLIISQLPYPDALSLKHSSRLLYPLIDTSVRLKVDWLIARKTRGLVCPIGNCVLQTDASFCASGGGEVRRIMERRRRHEECRKERGCEVIEGTSCPLGTESRRVIYQGLRRLWVKLREEAGSERFAALMLGFAMLIAVHCVTWIYLSSLRS